MARLPQPGADKGSWGQILNDYLSVTHNADGSFKDGVVAEAKLSSAVQTKLNSVGSGSVADGSITEVKLATAVQTKLNAAPTVTDGSITEAKLASAVQTKLNATLTVADGSITNIKVSGSAAIDKTKLAPLAIVDADVNTISQSKVTGLTAALGAKANTSSLADVAISGDYADLVNTPSLTAQTLSVSGVNLSISGGNTVVLPGGAGSASWGTISGTVSDQTDLQSALNAKAPLASPAFTGTPTGITKAHVGLANVDNTTDANKPVSNATQSALDLKADLTDTRFTNTRTPTDNTVSTIKLVDGSVTEPKLNVTNSPGTNQVLSWNGSALAWATPAAGGGGGGGYTAVSVTSAYTASAGDFVIGNATGGGFNVTLPAPANGARVTVKKLDNSANAILVLPPSGQINAGPGTSNSISVNSYGMVADFMADGTIWHQVG